MLTHHHVCDSTKTASNWCNLNICSLISFGLERYFAELTEKMQRYKLLKPKPVSLATVCRYISANFCYLRSAKSLYDYVRLRRAESEIINPIKVRMNEK